MSAQVAQVLVNAVLLIGVTLIAGSIGLKRFEAIDRRFEAMERSIGDLRSELKGDIADLRRELKADIVDLRAGVKADIGELRTTDFAQIRAEGVQLRAELAQLRSDVTYIGVAVGARRAEGSG